jgi:hypothetical protein
MSLQSKISFPVTLAVTAKTFVQKLKNRIAKSYIFSAGANFPWNFLKLRLKSLKCDPKSACQSELPPAQPIESLVYPVFEVKNFEKEKSNLFEGKKKLPTCQKKSWQRRKVVECILWKIFGKFTVFPVLISAIESVERQHHGLDGEYTDSGVHPA